MTLLEALEDIERTAGSENRGICGAVKVRLDVYPNDILHRLFRSWPEFSGNVNLPIRGIATFGTYETFAYASETGNLWTGKYGAARRRLLRHCIETLRQEAGITKEDDK